MVTTKLVQKKKVGSTNSEFPQKTESQDLPHGLGWRPSTEQPQPKTKPKTGGTSKNEPKNNKPNIIVRPPIAPPTGNNEFGFPVPQKF